MNPPPTISQRPMSGLARLQRLARPAQQQQERCELCGTPIGPRHEHLFEPKTRQLHCACQACAILFSGSDQQRYRRVPSCITLLPDLDISDDLWQSLHLPINLAFFYRSGATGKMIAVYPSPGGAVESLLPMDAWQEISARSPAVANLQSDVEAVVINRVKDRHDCFLVSIDECFKLVGLIRSSWRGLSGGEEAWQAIASFFDDLHHRSGTGDAQRA
jgi:Family of unknown function (DUF5947)